MIDRILIPCAVMDFEVEARPAGGLSPIERSFLELLKVGLNDYHQLQNVFEPLGARGVLDLVVELWQRGLVAVDDLRGTIHLSDRIASQVLPKQPDWPEQAGLKASERYVRDISAAQDLVSGQIVRAPSAPKFDRNSRRIPSVLRGPDLKGRDHALASVLQGLAGRTPAGRELEIERWRARTEPLNPEQLRWRPAWMEVEVEIRASADGDLLHFLVLGPVQAFGSRARRELAEALQRVSVDRADEIPIRELWSSVVGEGARDEVNMAGAVRALRDKLATADRATAGAVHDAMTVRWQDAVDILQSATPAGADVEVLVGAAAIDDAVLAACEATRKQLVIASPWVSHAGLARLKPALQAMAPGARATLVWGISGEEVLDPPIARLLMDLRREGTDVRESAYPARSHAKVLVRDNDLLMVSTRNLATVPSPELTEIAVLVHFHGRQDTTPPLLARALKWAREVSPDDDLGATLLDLARPDRGHAATPEPAPDLPQIPRPRGNLDDQTFDAWREDWLAVIQHLQGTYESAALRLRLVVDGDHRVLLRTALASATRRLLIVSDGLGDDVVHDAFVASLQALVTRPEPVRVCLVYRTPRGAARGRLDTLARAAPGFVHITADVHAKLLLWDDDMVVSSFNFLSFEGAYRARRRLRSEVGLHVHGSEAVRSMLDSLSELLPARAIRPLAEAGEVARALPTLPPRSISELALRLKSLPVGSRQRLAQIAATFRAPDAAALFRRFRAEWPYAADLDAATAAAVLGAGIEAAERRALVVEIALRRWHAGDTWTVRLLLPQCDPAEELPPLELAAALVAYDGVLSENAWARVDVTALPGAHVIVAAAAALPALLLRSVSAARPVLQDLSSRVPEALRTWLQATIRWWDRQYAPFPIAKVGAISERARLERELERKALAFEASCSRVESSRYTHKKDDWTVAELFRRDVGVLAQLRAAMSARDAGRVVEWIATHAPHGATNMMDAATLRALAADNMAGQKIEGMGRAPMIERLDALVAAAGAWADQRRSLGGGVEMVVLDQMQELAMAFAATTPGVRRLADAERGRATGVALSRLLDLLDPVVRLVNDDAS